MRLATTLLLLLLLPSDHALASSPAPRGPSIRPSEVQMGSLLLEGTDGLHAAPNVSTQVDIQVTGLIARTRVSQRFQNPTQDWVEGVYVFPLPTDSAVDQLQMRVGERVIEGQIQERAKARAVYEQSKSEGRKASLVEQERPNLFTTSVANLGPGETLEIRIAYQEQVGYDTGRFGLRFPMVTGPRYIPSGEQEGGQEGELEGEQEGEPGDGVGHDAGNEVSDGTGGAENTQAVPDASRITPPLALPETRSLPVSITVRVEPGFPLADIRSPSHAIRVTPGAANTYVVSLDEGSVPADSDFVLEWRSEIGNDPVAALFHEEWGGDHYALLMVVPPRPEAIDRVRPSREAIFVIDTSGSMDGESIVQARNALDQALSRLRPDDAFNVIRFDSTFSRLYSESRSADARSIAETRAWVRRLEAGGGTEMLPALRNALTRDRNQRALRQVVFITDGAVGNESALFQVIHDRLGSSRLFTVGIGSAPNSHFMSKAARLGRGTFTYIADSSEVETKMNALFAKLDNPVLHDLAIEWNRASVEAWPARLPDVYLGEPLVVAARLPQPSNEVNEVVVRGRRGAERVRIEVPMRDGSTQSGIARLWARRKIASLLDSLRDGAEFERVSDAVTALGLRHHLVTRWTSLIAVDVTPSAPVDVDLETRAVPTLLPKGWTLRGLFGRPPERGVPGSAPPVRDSSLRMAAATDISQPNLYAAPGRLPQGATPAALLFWIGSLLIASSALLRHWGRRA
jgi:Ca-activated chloride channel family protein